MGCSWGSCLEGAACVGFGELLLPQVVAGGSRHHPHPISSPALGVTHLHTAP